MSQRTFSDKADAESGPYGDSDGAKNRAPTPRLPSAEISASTWRTIAIIAILVAIVAIVTGRYGGDAECPAPAALPAVAASPAPKSKPAAVAAVCPPAQTCPEAPKCPAPKKCPAAPACPKCAECPAPVECPACAVAECPACDNGGCGRTQQELLHWRRVYSLVNGLQVTQRAACSSANVPINLAELDRSEDQTFKNVQITEWARKYGLRTFVETGTFMGDTVETQIPHFDTIYSIELSTELHKRAKDRFKAKRDKVKLIHGDAAAEIAALLPKLDAPALFWLDGHFSPNHGAIPTAQGEMDTPIMYELGALFRWAHVTRSVLLIDDARFLLGYEDNCKGSPLCYPTPEQLRYLMCEMQPDMRFKVFAGLIFIYPAEEAAL